MIVTVLPRQLALFRSPWKIFLAILFTERGFLSRAGSFKDKRIQDVNSGHKAWRTSSECDGALFTFVFEGFLHL